MRIAIFLLAIFIIGARTDAQSENQPAPCMAHPALQPFIGLPDFDSACAVFNTCAENNTALACAPHFLAARISLCDPDNAICHVQAQLHSALIGLTLPPHTYEPPSAALATLSRQIADTFALREISLDEASAWYLPLIEAYREHPMLDYSLAVLNAFNGNPASADALFKIALAGRFDDALIQWSWGHFLAQLKEPELELSNIAFITFLSTANLDSLPEAMQRAILDPILAQVPPFAPPVTYIEYPILKQTGITVGVVASDLSLLEGKPRKMQDVGGGIILLIREDTDTPREWYDVQPDSLSFRMDENNALFFNTNAFYNDIILKVSLWPRPDGGYNGQRTFTLPEARIYEEFILMPLTSTDPRSTIFRCPDAPLPLLSAGMTVTPSLYDNPFRLHFSAGDSTAIEIYSAPVTIVEGPVCARGGTWYRVVGSGFAGWVRENADNHTYAIIAG